MSTLVDDDGSPFARRQASDVGQALLRDNHLGGCTEVNEASRGMMESNKHQCHAQLREEEERVISKASGRAAPTNESASL